MTGHGQALSLGALFHHLRDGLADRGLARITIEFRLESTTSGNGGGGGSHLFVKRGFRADLDYEDEVLRAANLVSTGMSPRPLAELRITLHDRLYLYSTDGISFGRLVDTPRLYDVYSFESRLSRIEVRDVILEEDRQPDGSTVHILRVDLDDDAFRRLIHLFGDDVNAMLETLETGDRSMVMTAGAGVGIHYRWTTGSEEHLPGVDGMSERYVSRHCSRVSIRLEPLAAITAEVPIIDVGLPQLGGVDDLWSAMRQAHSANRSLSGRQP